MPIWIPLGFRKASDASIRSFQRQALGNIHKVYMKNEIKENHRYGMRNVALFDIFVFLLDLTSLLLYIFGFVFNGWPFLFYMFRFYSIFYDLYSISVYFILFFFFFFFFFFCIIFVYIVYSVICIVYFWICI